MHHKYYSSASLLITIALLLSCSAGKQIQTMEKQPVAVNIAVPVNANSTANVLEELLRNNPQYFAGILSSRKALNVQVIYTRIDREKNGEPSLQPYYFNTNAANYFYPASIVKLPICLLALQKLNALMDKGIDRSTSMITEAGNNIQSAVYNDPTAADGRPSIAHYIKKILLVSDNDAFNRLYEFLGQEYINAELHKKGYKDAQILHRLNIFLSAEENRRTNPVRFISVKDSPLYEQPMKYNSVKYADRIDTMGKAYYSGNTLINGPMDFSKKNRICLEDLHTITTSIIFPQKVPAYQRFNMSEDDRQFILKYMSQFPTESVFPPYSADTATFPPAYCKFLLFGGRNGILPQHIRSFSKSGQAYGQLVESAYIMDVDNGIEFLLSAAIYCNSDGVLNDDSYDYTTIGLPFMQHLGQVIYDMEKQRTKKNKPDLSAFIFNYDK